VSDVKGKVNSTADDVRKNATELKKRTGRAIEGAKQGFNETDVKKFKKEIIGNARQKNKTLMGECVETCAGKCTRNFLLFL